ncbi:sigma-54-dependent Fis family transcriptional regulator [Candidatus Sumerlaeota bacterium]|nr:sigma-54-dependent Fis family transcriptional regulator [Candidatus Sumerlaeota bacterium]
MNRETLNPFLPVLIVDDEPRAIESCEFILCAGGIENILVCEDSRKVPEILAEREIGIILLDLSMPGLPGEELLKIITEDHPYIPVIIITGRNEVKTAVDCMKLGAFDYMVKPVEKSRMISGVKRAIEMRELRHEYNLLSRELLSNRLEYPEAFKEIVSNHPRMRSIFQYTEAAAKTSKPVLITGETGVGKELVARAIHEISGRKGEFVCVNVAGVDDGVFSDTLFGHVKGAFTDAGQIRSGLVEKASGGTLFLDEIGDLSMASQVKLLRLLQEREYFPIGSDVSKTSDARIITSTNQDLKHLENARRFRNDLYFRLKTHHIHIPPLRERLSDLALMVNHFLEKASGILNKKKPTPPRELITLLSTYHFPGNVRELESMIYDAVSNHRSGQLSMKIFKAHIHKEQPMGAKNHKILMEKAEEFFVGREILPTVKEVNELLITEALRRAKGNQSIAAQLLGMTQSALNKRLKRSPGKFT